MSVSTAIPKPRYGLCLGGWHTVCEVNNHVREQRRVCIDIFHAGVSVVDYYTEFDNVLCGKCTRLRHELSAEANQPSVQTGEFSKWGKICNYWDVRFVFTNPLIHATFF